MRHAAHHLLRDDALKLGVGHAALPRDELLHLLRNRRLQRLGAERARLGRCRVRCSGLRGVARGGACGAFGAAPGTQRGARGGGAARCHLAPARSAPPQKPRSHARLGSADAKALPPTLSAALGSSTIPSRASRSANVDLMRSCCLSSVEAAQRTGARLPAPPRAWRAGLGAGPPRFRIPDARGCPSRGPQPHWALRECCMLLGRRPGAETLAAPVDILLCGNVSLCLGVGDCRRGGAVLTFRQTRRCASTRPLPGEPGGDLIGR